MSWTFGEKPSRYASKSGLELLLAGAGTEVAKRELRRIVERLARGPTQCLILVDDFRLVKRVLHLQNGRLARLQDRVEPPEHGHG